MRFYIADTVAIIGPMRTLSRWPVMENVLAKNLNQGVWLINSIGNLIFLNDLIDDNIWYNPGSKKGNYWSDYNGQDADGDGIGDTPHPVKGFGSGAEDRYPSGQTVSLETR